MIIELETDFKVRRNNLYVLGKKSCGGLFYRKILLISSGFGSPEDYFRLCFSMEEKAC